MEAFKRIKLGQALAFQRGFDITKTQQTDGSIPIVSSSGVSSHHNVAKADPPGIVIGRKGTLGTVHFLNMSYWPHDTTLWVKDFKGNDPRFLYYFLKTLRLENFDTGSSNPTLNRNHLHKIDVIFPANVETQRKIAGILSAYDDLIENNRRRIAILERMAEELYREWFVRMRFPGYQNTTFVKGVPEGWEITRLSDIAEVNPETISNSNRLERIHYVDISTVTTNQIGIPVEYTFGEAPGRARRVVKHGDTIWSSVRPGNRVFALVQNPIPNLIVSTGFAVLRPKEGIPFSYVHNTVATQVFTDYLVSVAKGSAYPATSFEDFENAQILKPSDSILLAYDKHCERLFTQVWQLSQTISKLIESREAVLSRLISGRLNVESLNILLPPSMKDRLATSDQEPANA